MVFIQHDQITQAANNLSYHTVPCRTTSLFCLARRGHIDKVPEHGQVLELLRQLLHARLIRIRHGKAEIPHKSSPDRLRRGRHRTLPLPVHLYHDLARVVRTYPALAQGHGQQRPADHLGQAIAFPQLDVGVHADEQVGAPLVVAGRVLQHGIGDVDEGRVPEDAVGGRLVLGPVQDDKIFELVERSLEGRVGDLVLGVEGDESSWT